MKIIVFLAIPVFALSSCNTVVGFGRDIKSLGQGVENKAYGKQWNGKPSAKPAFYHSKTLKSTVPQTTVE